ncbi:hypothetical protein MGG_15479 [Pyricularia oryzae 70-15]|uniref:SGNH hydrolase-type esterase domain-containing protein n=1 Tax=Pyricularia oryzae (strain 70-15 / ATCC MYA-4617 / FGSC 8958) TaxID=242507 RepID=G4MS26_PYRO7|nr:uncharacterized protein MGG_15479 [Pyricularia oryzae 70-15]EHA57492.1 hypothetical protein MGG_15479 [Pyricularia oryzae 70-15]
MRSCACSNRLMAAAFLIGVMPLIAHVGAAPTEVPQQRGCQTKPFAFFLAGDSTTAIQSPNGGGWGTGFLSYLNDTAGAWGVNHGINGATTASFVDAGEWARVISSVQQHSANSSCVVTIQFGHNDQLPSRGVSREQFQSNLEKFAIDVQAAGGLPVILSPLSRRDFWDNGTLVDSLGVERSLAMTAAGNSGARFVDLNQASASYVQALGAEASNKYNSSPRDTTHLDKWGSVVFGRMVADLLLGHDARLDSEDGDVGMMVQNPELTLLQQGGSDELEPRAECLKGWIVEDKELSRKIWRGDAA